jgi:hypothetical protein
MVTTRAAVTTDIHGNVPALKTALGRHDEVGVENVYCGSDLERPSSKATATAAAIRMSATAAPTSAAMRPHARPSIVLAAA